MFDKNKIILNHVRASNSKNIKANKLLERIAKDIIERENFSNDISYSILDLWSRNDNLYNFFKKKKTIRYFSTLCNFKIKTKNKKKIVSSISPPFKENCFDYCFSIFSVGSSEDVINTFKRVHSILKTNGKFICIFPAEDSFKEFKTHFSKCFYKMDKKSFLPYIDIFSLGKIGRISGFKNIVIDKSAFYLKVNEPKEIWEFIRNIGEGNTLKDHKVINIKKKEYLDFYNKLDLFIKNKNFKNTLSFNYFTGMK